MILLEIYLVFFFVFALGVWAGKIITDRRWRSNARVPMRIASGGRLYKVVLQEDFKGG